MAQHRLAALGVELGDAVRLDVALAGEAELLLDRELDRQAVAVPAGLALDVVALHGLEPREDVLEDAGLDVVGAGHAVGGRRALVEGPRAAAAGARRGTCAKVSCSRPEREHLALERGQVDLRGDGACTRSRLVLVGRPSAGSTAAAEGTRPAVCAGPAVPPSLAARCCRAAHSWCTAAGSTRPTRAGRALFRRLRGDLRSGQHPRALTVPGSLPAVLGATRPVHAVRSRPVCQTGPRPGSSRFPSGAGRSRKVTESWARWLSRCGRGISSPHACGGLGTGEAARSSGCIDGSTGAARPWHGIDGTQAGRHDRRPPAKRVTEQAVTARAAAKKAPAKTVAKAAAKKATPAKKAPAKKAPAQEGRRQEGRRQEGRPRRRPRAGEEGARRRRRRPRRRAAKKAAGEEGPGEEDAPAKKAPAKKAAAKKAAREEGRREEGGPGEEGSRGQEDGRPRRRRGEEGSDHEDGREEGPAKKQPRRTAAARGEAGGQGRREALDQGRARRGARRARRRRASGCAPSSTSPSTSSHDLMRDAGDGAGNDQADVGLDDVRARPRDEPGQQRPRDARPDRAGAGSASRTAPTASARAAGSRSARCG